METRERHFVFLVIFETASRAFCSLWIRFCARDTMLCESRIWTLCVSQKQQESCRTMPWVSLNQPYLVLLGESQRFQFSNQSDITCLLGKAQENFPNKLRIDIYSSTISDVLILTSCCVPPSPVALCLHSSRERETERGLIYVTLEMFLLKVVFENYFPNLNLISRLRKRPFQILLVRIRYLIDTWLRLINFRARAIKIYLNHASICWFSSLLLVVPFSNLTESED